MDKPLVKVVWHDAADEERTWITDSEVMDAVEADEPVEFVSFGILLGKTKKYITIAGDFSTQGTSELTWGRVTRIPRGMVKSLKTLDF